MLFVLFAAALCVGGVVSVLGARQLGSLAFGLVAALTGAGFLLMAPGWYRTARDKH